MKRKREVIVEKIIKIQSLLEQARYTTNDLSEITDQIIAINQNNMTVEEFKKVIRELIANYMRSEGCTCCQDLEEHADVKRRLGELLNCGKYNDEDEYNFYQYATKK